MPSSNSGVRSRILDFEKQNDEVRSSCSLSPAASPRSAGSGASVDSFTRFVAASRTEAIKKIGAQEAAAASTSSTTKSSLAVKAAYNKKTTAMARAHLRPHSSATTTTTSPAATTRPSGTGSAGTASTVAESSVDTSLPKKKAPTATNKAPSPDRPPSSTHKASVIRINRLQARLEEKTASPRPPKKKQQQRQPSSPKASPVKSAAAAKKPLSPKASSPKDDPTDPNSPTAINLRNLRQKTTFHQRILGLAEEHVQRQNKQQKQQQQQRQPQQVLSQPTLSPQSSVEQRNNNHRKGPSPAALLRGAALSKEIDPTSPARTRSRSAIRSRPVSRDSDRHHQPASLSPERWQQAVEKLSPEKRQPLLAAVSSSPMARMRTGGAAAAKSSHNEMAAVAASSGNGSVPEHHGRRHRQALHQLNQHEEEDVDDLFYGVDDDELRLQQPPSVKQHLRSKHANAIMRQRQHRPQQKQQLPDNDNLSVPQFDEHFTTQDFPHPLPTGVSTEPDFIPERDFFPYPSAKQQQHPEAAKSPRLSLGRRRRSPSRQKEGEVHPQPQVQKEELQPTSPRHILRLQQQFSPMSHGERSSQSRSSLDQPRHRPQHHAISPQSQQSPPDLQALASPQLRQEQHAYDSPTKSHPEHESFPQADNHLSFSPARSTTSPQSYSSNKLPDRRRRRHHPQQRPPPHRRRYRDAIPDEDEMTLTSVRQIIDTQQDSGAASNGNPNSSKSQRLQRPHRSSSSTAAACHNNRDNQYFVDSDDFEEKKSESTHTAAHSHEKQQQWKQQHQELNQNNSSSSGYEMDYETGSSRGDGDGVAPSYEESDIIRQSSSTKEQPQPYLSMSTSVMTPEFFDQKNANKDASPQRHRHPDRANHKNNHNNSKRVGSGAGGAASGASQQISVAKAGDDDETYDYGSRSDDDQNDTDNQSNNSHYSLSYEQRRLKQARETKVREAAIAKAKQEMEDGGGRGGGFIQKEKVEKYRKNIDTPLARTAAGVAAAATVGCMVLGPVGLLVGAAAVGIGIGYMEIPEEQRKNINSKTAEAVNSAQESILNASEKLSNSCAATYQDSGISDHVPVEIQTCCTDLGMGGLGGDNDTAMAAGDEQDGSVMVAADDKLQNGISREWTGPGDQSRAMMSKSGGILVVSPTNDGTGRFRERSNRSKVACLRKGKFVPVAQIHSLDPATQPRAWIDVISSADSEVFEKIEAAEEILILAKDKMRARMFVEEGILDAVMWIMDRYLEKTRRGPGWETWAFPDISKDEARLARLAASCCLTLGKSYCAAIHTEGDLLLMSLYERGTVPEERQLAQMLHEVPHHTRATQTEDPTIVTPGHEMFALKTLTLPQAEELAATIYGLATGQQEV